MSEQFSIGDRVVHAGEYWWLDYKPRTGRVIDINPSGTSYRGNRNNTWACNVVKLKVDWDRVPCSRVQQTRSSWVNADMCTKLSDGAMPIIVVPTESLLPLSELPEVRALLDVLTAPDYPHTPELDSVLAPFLPAPVIDGMRADDV